MIPVWVYYAFMAATTAVQVYSSVQQGKFQRGMAEYNASLAEWNKKVKQREAQALGEKMQYEIKQKRRQKDLLTSRQKALYAKAGVDIESGSPLLVMLDSVDQAEQDIMMLDYARSLDIQRVLAGGEAMDFEAALFRAEGRFRERAGYLGAMGSLLKGAASIYGMGSRPTFDIEPEQGTLVPSEGVGITHW